MRVLPSTWVLLCSVLVGCSDGPRLTSAPLAPRSPGGVGFKLHSPAETGLSFQNELRRAHVIPYIYNGAGCAVGDIDGDGLADVYLVSQDGPNRLFRQVAPFRFVDVTESAGVDGGDAWGAGASFVDIDGDGDLDLYVCNTEAPNLLYDNRGDGRFVERAKELGIAHTGASTMPAFADYDNDGDVDLFVLTNRVLGPTLPRALVDDVEPPADTATPKASMIAPELAVRENTDGIALAPEFRGFYFVYDNQRVYAAGQRDRLFRNEGGRFRDVTGIAGIADQGMGLGAVWWDFDDDGWLDLYVANDLESPDQLYHNQRDGRFREVANEVLPHVAYFGMGADFADLNNDGRFDFMVADMSSTTHYKSKMIMGEMDRRSWFLANARPAQIMRNAVFLNTGTRRFLEIGKLAGVASTDWTWAIKFGDFDNDGWVDLFVTNGIPRFDNNPDLNPRFQALWNAGQRQRALDLARNIDAVKEKNLAFKNDGALHFADVSTDWGLDHEGVSHGAVSADLDRDGDLDLVVNNLNEPALVYENLAGAGHAILVRLHGTRSEPWGLGAKVTVECGASRQVRLMTLAHGYLSADEPLLHFGLGDATAIDRLTVRWPSGVSQTFTELEVDRLYTIREPSGGEPTPEVSRPKPVFVDRTVALGLEFDHREREFDDYALQPLVPHKHSQLGPGVAIGDANGDGRDDVYVGGAAGQSGQLWLAVGTRYQAVDGPWREHRECEDTGAVWFDYDADGDVDLYVASGSIEAEPGAEVYRDRLYRNDAGSFVHDEAALPELRESSSAVAVADYDRDGDLDLFVGSRIVRGSYPRSPASHLLRNDGGRFVDATSDELAKAGLVTGALWSDADGDGWLDLLVTAHWAPVRLFRNDRGTLRDSTEAAGLAPHSGLWNGVTGADFDSDGDVDYLVTNLGLNTKYKATPERPSEVYCSDFDSDGVLDVVEAKFEGETLYPVRGRSCSSRAMPFLAEKFPTFDSFAKAPLAQIYPLEVVAKDDVFRATTLQSSLLVNQGDGRFEVRPLPFLAQVAPGFGIGVWDYDGDGDTDAYLAQNFFTPEPETGRMAGGVGLLLRNDGELSLNPVMPDRSGIVVGGDGKGVAVGDLDGDGCPDLLAVTNDGPVRAFVNQRSPRLLRVRAEHGAGAPAVGARIEAVRTDGSAQVVEVHAGSGYWSQSSAQAWFGGVEDIETVRVRWPDGEITEEARGERLDLVLRR